MTSRWAQFVALGHCGELSVLPSEPAVTSSATCALQPHKFYRLGVRAFVNRSSLPRVNAQQPYTLYEALFGRLPARCQQRARRHDFGFKNKLVRVGRVDHRLVPAGLPRGLSFRRTLAWRIKQHRRRGPGATSAVVHQRDRRQDRRRHGGSHVDVVDRHRAVGGRLRRILISVMAPSVAPTARAPLVAPPDAERALSETGAMMHDVDIRTRVLSDSGDRVAQRRPAARLVVRPGLRRVELRRPPPRGAMLRVRDEQHDEGGEDDCATCTSRGSKSSCFSQWIKQHLKVKRVRRAPTKNVRSPSQLRPATCLYPLLAEPEVRPATARSSLHRDVTSLVQLNLFDQQSTGAIAVEDALASRVRQTAQMRLWL